MADLLRIEEPGAAGRARPQWAAFLELGFRPLYLLGCLWAAVSIALWVFAPQLLRGQLVSVFWHAHEMLWGFVTTIAAGFLLTAVSNWTGINPLKGRALGAACVLWLVARAGFLVPGAAAFAVAAVAEVLFFGWAALALGRAIYPRRSRRNYGVPLLMLGLGLADALYLLAAWRGDYVALLARLQTGLLLMALVALLIARRVIPFFATRAVQGLVLPMHTRSGHVQLAAGTLAIAAQLAGWPQLAAALLALTGALALVHVLAWRPLAVRRVPLLWILYAGYAAMGAGILVWAVQVGGWLAEPMRAAWPVHVVGVAGFSVLIIGMVTRTALGHLGRPLRTDRLMVWCYVLVLAAAALRLLALAPGPWTLGALHGSAGAWVLAFALYLWRFVPMLIRPRADAAPKAAMPAMTTIAVARRRAE
ncbi:MAG: NnrS family protein [Bordetella sp.]|nr:NnrS family protein [Bordetella sp.]